MSVKSIIIKAVTGLLAVGILVGCIIHMLKPAKSEDGESIIVYSAVAEDVKGVEITGAEEYTLKKTSDGWVMEGLEGVEVDKTFADTLVKSLCNIKSPMEVESFGVKMSDYGLDKPLITAKLDFGTKTKTIKIGNSTGEYHYLKIDGDIYLVTKEDLYMVMLEKMKYLNDSVLSLNPETVTEISYKSMKVVKNDNGWTLIEPFSFNADNDKVKEVLEKICEISAADIVKKEEVKDGERVWVSLVLGDDKVIGFCVAGDCILFEHAEYAFKVNMDELEFLNLTAFDLSQKYIAPIAINEITSLKFVSNEGVVDFTIEAPDSEASVFYKNGTEVSDVLFRDFYQKLMGLTFTKEGAIEGVVEYSITFTKTDGTVFAVQFLPYSETEYAIDINGLKRFLINKKSVTDIYEAAKSLQ